MNNIRIHLFISICLLLTSCSNRTESLIELNQDILQNSIFDSTVEEVYLEELVSKIEYNSEIVTTGTTHCQGKHKIIKFIINSDKMNENIGFNYCGYDNSDFKYLDIEGHNKELKNGVVPKNHHMDFAQGLNNKWSVVAKLASYRPDNSGFMFHYSLVNNNKKWSQFPRWDDCSGMGFTHNLTKYLENVLE